MSVKVQGRVVGYADDGYTDKNTGQWVDKHLLSVSTGDGVELVEIRSDLIPHFAPLSGDDAFGASVEVPCEHRIGYRNYERASVLIARSKPEPLSA